jgi:hypothetical protein
MKPRLPDTPEGARSGDHAPSGVFSVASDGPAQPTGAVTLTASLVV